MNGYDYWKTLTLETIINFVECGTNVKITEKQVENTVLNLLNDDELWQTIDFAIINAINKNSNGERI